VEFGYAAGQPVLHGLSLEVRAGEHVALVGRTGAGKTSALHLIAGLYRPWAGRVLVAGHDPARLTEAAFAYAREEGLRVVPTCSYAALWVERHPEVRALVQEA